LELIANWHSWL